MSAEKIKSLDEAFKLMQQIPFASESREGAEGLYDSCVYIAQDMFDRYLNCRDRFNFVCVMGVFKYVVGALERHADEMDKGLSELVLDMLNRGLTDILIKGKVPDEEE